MSLDRPKGENIFAGHFPEPLQKTHRVFKKDRLTASHNFARNQLSDLKKDRRDASTEFKTETFKNDNPNDGDTIQESLEYPEADRSYE